MKTNNTYCNTKRVLWIVKAQVCGSVDELAILLIVQLLSSLIFVEEANSDVVGEGGASSGKERRKQEPYDKSLPAQHLVRAL